MMWYPVSAIIISGIITAIIGIAGRRRRRRSVNSGTERAGNGATPAVSEGCCGRHEVCERDSLPAAVSKNIEYYDDEELDAYAGKESDRYGETETEEFRDVLYTMRETEVAGWLRSLQLRGINLPDRLKDEALLIIEEQRQKNE
jgi:hypothetical protein